MADLNINLNGLELKNPVLTASGIFGYGLEFQDFIQLDKLGGFIVKGTTLKHREGNSYPRMAETPSGMLNAVGLQNKGVDYFIERIYPEIKDIIETTETPSIVPNEETEEREEKEGTILLVDDNEEFLLLMKRKLAMHYSVLTATNGKKALEIVRAEDVDLMVSDYMMPEMDGIELCETMKQDINTSHIPVLMLTAKNSVEDQVKCFNAGANGYLTKPFDMKMLNARIDNLMRSNQKRQEKFRVDTEINVVALEYQSTDEQFLEKAIECIEQHLIETEFDIDTFASELSVSKSTLNRKMKAMTGLSPVEFIRNIRLKHACILLKKPFINVTEVAYAVGFSNPKYFTKCFKKEFDVTPTEYQKKEEEK